MIEYLNPKTWELHVIDGENEAVAEDWILVPNGAERYTEGGFFKDKTTRWGDTDGWVHSKGFLGYEDIKWQRTAQQTVNDTLKQRESQYGSFEDVADVTVDLLSILEQAGLKSLPKAYQESLHMICSKMARIVNGNCNHLDSWHDIGGYAKLIENIIEDKKC